MEDRRRIGGDWRSTGSDGTGDRGCVVTADGLLALCGVSRESNRKENPNGRIGWPRASQSLALSSSPWRGCASVTFGLQADVLHAGPAGPSTVLLFRGPDARATTAASTSKRPARADDAPPRGSLLAAAQAVSDSHRRTAGTQVEVASWRHTRASSEPPRGPAQRSDGPEVSPRMDQPGASRSSSEARPRYVELRLPCAADRSIASPGAPIGVRFSDHPLRGMHGGGPRS
jgi:hypothetical protein